MSSQLMPDFADALELRLRAEALASAPSAAGRRRRRRGLDLGLALRHRRLVASFAACLALTGVVIAVSGTRHGHVPTAYGRPLVLKTAPVDATDELAGGIAAAAVFGPGARFDRARPIPAFGGTAYLVSGPKGWCLSAPDATHPDPDRARGVTCTPTADFLRYGIALTIGPSFIAAVPQGVKPPTVRAPDGTTRTLTPSQDQGVAIAEDLAKGTVVTTYDIDGHRRSLRVR